MLGELFKAVGMRRRYPDPESVGRIYAIGDIHGRADLLMPLMERIVAEGDPDIGPPLVVFLGDYIDRGPDSADALELLTTVAGWTEIKPVFLLGNHELMLLRFLSDPVSGRRWLRYGGYETLLSYGVSIEADLDEPGELARLSEALGSAMGPHRDFVEDLLPMHRNGNLLFTHAGADPGLPPEAQTIEALAWGVPAFETGARSDGLWVVHGHTIVDSPIVRDGRISIDTGAWKSGQLTALKMQGKDLSFLTQTGPEGSDLD